MAEPTLSEAALPEAAGSLRRNVSWSFLGNLVHAGTKWASLVVLARLSGAEDVGTLALATAMVAPVFMLLNLQLREIQSTDARGRYSFETVWGIRLGTTAVAGLVVAAGAWLRHDDPTLSWVLVAVALSHAFDALSDAVHGRLQRQERLDWIARSMAGRGLASLGLLAGIYALTGSLPWAAGGMAIASAAMLVGLDLPALRALEAGRLGVARASLPWLPRPRIAREELAPLFRSALPLGGTMLLVSLNGNLPRYFIEAHLGRAELGVFAALAQLVAAGNIAISAAANAASPRLARHAARGELAAFHRVSRALYKGVLALGVGGILLSWGLGDTILGAVFGAEFAEASDVLVWLAVGGTVGFACAVPGYGMTAAGAHGAQFPLFVGINLVGLGACAALIPRLGLHGAALAVLVTYGAQWLGSRLVLGRRLAQLEPAA